MTDLTPSDVADARRVADRFLDAVREGDEATAHSLLVICDDESVEMPGMSKEENAGYELGPGQVEGDQVIVKARLWRTPPGETELEEQEMPMVVRREEGDWKIDIGASITRMFGFDMGEAFTQIAEGLGEAISEGVEAMAKGLGETQGVPSEAEADPPQLPSDEERPA